MEDERVDGLGIEARSTARTYRYRPGVNAAAQPATALRGRVAVVAGATRGAGRGIAVGARARPARPSTCTGRSARGARSRARPAGDDRGDRRARRRGRRARHRRALRPPRCRAGRALARASSSESRPARRARQRHLGRRALVEWGMPFWEHDLGERPARSCGCAVDTHLITSPPALPLLVERGRRPGGRGHRRRPRTRYRGILFYDLAKTSVIRLAVGPGARAHAARRRRRRAHAGLPALGGDARALRRDRGELARRRPPRPALRALRDARATSAARSRRSRPTPT